MSLRRYSMTSSASRPRADRSLSECVVQYSIKKAFLAVPKNRSSIELPDFSVVVLVSPFKQPLTTIRVIAKALKSFTSFVSADVRLSKGHFRNAGNESKIVRKKGRLKAAPTFDRRGG